MGRDQRVAELGNRVIQGLLVVPGGFSNQTYQLGLNTVTSIVTYLMVFVIQSAQNRDNRAIHAKLDAHSRALRDIATRLGVEQPDDLLTLIGLEQAPERQIQHLHDQVRSGHHPPGQ